MSDSVAFKTYVLLPNMDVNAPVYTRINKEQRVRVDKLPKWCPFLRITFQDENGKNVTTRYKQTATTIIQSEQIKDGIPANDPWTSNERKAMEFTNGVLVTKDKMAQSYLDQYPGNKNFKGFCPDIEQPVFEEYNKSSALKSENKDFKLRTNAASKIVELDLKGAQDMLLRLNGSFFEVPSAVDGKSEEDALIECQQLLVTFLDAAEEAGLNAILDEETQEDKVTIMLGKLLSAGIVSFDAVEGQVSKKIKNQWVKLSEMSSGIEVSEKQRLFVDFLNSDEGKMQLADLKKDEKKIDKE